MPRASESGSLAFTPAASYLPSAQLRPAWGAVRHPGGISVRPYEPQRLHLALQPLEPSSAEDVEDKGPLPLEPGPRGHEDAKDRAAGK